MTIALWCVLAAALMPYLWVGVAKADPAFIKEGHNKAPRDYEAGLSGAKQRAYWAHLNAFESFPAFAAAVLVAHYAEAAQGTVDVLAGVFVVCRLLHGVTYIVNQDTLRSVVWATGLACVIGLFVVSA